VLGALPALATGFDFAANHTLLPRARPFVSSVFAAGSFQLLSSSNDRGANTAA